MFYVLNYVVYACGAVAIITLPFMFVFMMRGIKNTPLRPTPLQRWENTPKRTMLLFGGSILVAILISTVLSAMARYDALAFLGTLSNTHSILIDNRPIGDESGLIADLKAVHFVIGHHSHPTKAIRLTICANGRVLNLDLKRDSDDPQEYWAFSTDDRFKAGDEIGRVFTRTLDGY